MRIAIQIILAVAILVVGWFVFRSARLPMQFNREQQIRYDATIQRLRDIRTAQLAFRSEHRRYTGSFDTLIDFLKTGTFSMVRIVGDLDDSAAVAGGKITRDTLFVSVIDSLFRKGFPVDSLRYVPFTQDEEFELGTANITAGNVVVNVFEAKVSNEVLLRELIQPESKEQPQSWFLRQPAVRWFFGLDPDFVQLAFNFDRDRQIKTGIVCDTCLVVLRDGRIAEFKSGLRVGSLTETTNNAGNWE